MPATARRGKGLRIAVIACLLLFAGFLVAEQRLTQMMLDTAYARAYSLAVETVNRAVLDVLEGGLRYDELMETLTDGAGRVTMLRANTVRMNELAAQTALMAEEELAAVENETVQIPLAAALGVRFLAGFGPRLSVRIMPVGAVGTRFVTDFESAGINQTRHRVYLTLHTTVRLIVPAGSQLVEVTSTVPVAESIIVGDVPDSFVDVSDQEDMLNLIP